MKTSLIHVLSQQIVAVLTFGLYLVLYRMTGIVTYILHKLHPAGNPHSFVKGAQLGRIRLRRKFDLVYPASQLDFLCLFWSKVQPEYVLRPNISLYCVTNDEAFFVETPPGVNIYSSDENPFLYMAQYNRAQNVIRMSIQTFHTLAEKIGDPSVPVIWVSNIGRCGSTMLCQVMEKAAGSLVMSEPDAPLNVCSIQNLGYISDKEFDDLIRSTVKALTKPYPGTRRVVVKTRSQCAALMTSLSQLFPVQIKQIFMYRNCLDSVISFNTVFGTLPVGSFIIMCANNETVSYFLPFFRKLFRSIIQCKLRTMPDIPLSNTYEQLVHMWANFMVLARDALSRDPDILLIRYEDLVSNPQETIKIIFQNLEIDFEHIDIAVTSLSHDSQRGTQMSGNKFRDDPCRKISSEDRATTDRILHSYNLPPTSKTFKL